MSSPKQTNGQSHPDIEAETHAGGAEARSNSLASGNWNTRPLKDYARSRHSMDDQRPIIEDGCKVEVVVANGDVS